MRRKKHETSNMKKRKRDWGRSLAAAAASGLILAGCAPAASQNEGSGAYSSAAVQTSEEYSSLEETADFTETEPESSTETEPEASTQEEVFVDPPDVEELDTIYAYIDGRLYYYDGLTYGMTYSYGYEISAYASYVGKGIKTDALPDKDMEVRGISEPYVWYDFDMEPVYYYYGGTEPEIYYSEKEQTYYVWDEPYSFRLRPWDEDAADFLRMTNEERHQILFDEEYPALSGEQLRLWEERMEQYEPSETLQDWVCAVSEYLTNNFHPLSQDYACYDIQEQQQVYQWDGTEGRIRAEQVIYEILNYYDVLGRGDQELYVELDISADEAERLTGLSLKPALKYVEPEKYAHVCFGYVTVDTLMELYENGYSTQIYLLNERKPQPFHGELNGQLTPDTALEIRVCFFRVVGMYKTYDDEEYYMFDEETGEEMRVIRYSIYQPD